MGGCFGRIGDKDVQFNGVRAVREPPLLVCRLGFKAFGPLRRLGDKD